MYGGKDSGGPKSDRTPRPKGRKSPVPTAFSSPLTPRATLLEFPDVFIDSRFGSMRIATWEDKGDSKVVKKFITDHEEAERLSFKPNLRPTRESLAGRDSERSRSRSEKAASPFMLQATKAQPGESAATKSPMELKRNSTYHGPRTSPVPDDNHGIGRALDDKPKRSASVEGHHSDDEVSMDGRPASDDNVLIRREKEREGPPGRRPRVAFDIPDKDDQSVESGNEEKSQSLKYTKLRSSPKTGAEQETPPIRVEINLLKIHSRMDSLATPETVNVDRGKGLGAYHFQSSLDRGNIQSPPIIKKSQEESASSSNVNTASSDLQRWVTPSQRPSSALKPQPHTLVDRPTSRADTKITATLTKETTGNQEEVSKESEPSNISKTGFSAEKFESVESGATVAPVIER